MKLEGKLKVIKDTHVVSESFKKREFVLTTQDGNYTQDILFQLTQDKVSLLDTIQVNERVEIEFNLNGKEWISPDGTSKYFNVLSAWKISKL